VKGGRRRDMSAARLARAAVASLPLLAGAGEARAQTDTSSPATQVWLTATPAWTKSERLYLALKVEPQWQVSSGEEWHSFNATPILRYYAAGWLDLDAELELGTTRQGDGVHSLQVTPRGGARFHLFAKMAPRGLGVPGWKDERLPLTRVSISTLVRLEWRSYYYSDDTPDSHEWRARLRLEGKVALNRPKLTDERTLYATGDVEYYAPLGDDVSETYVNKVRGRLGLGFRFSGSTRLELLYVRDWNRDSPTAPGSEDSQAVDLAVNLSY
jgi:hypothetical protein